MPSVKVNPVIPISLLASAAVGAMLLYFGVKEYDHAYQKHLPKTKTNSTNIDTSKAYKAAQLSFLPYLAGLVIIAFGFTALVCITNKKESSYTREKKSGPGLLALLKNMFPTSCSNPCNQQSNFTSTASFNSTASFKWIHLHPKHLAHAFITSIAEHKLAVFSTLTYLLASGLLLGFGIKKHDAVRQKEGFSAAQKAFIPYVSGFLALTLACTVGAIVECKNEGITNILTRLSCCNKKDDRRHNAAEMRAVSARSALLGRNGSNRPSYGTGANAVS